MTGKKVKRRSVKRKKSRFLLFVLLLALAAAGYGCAALFNSDAGPGPSGEPERRPDQGGADEEAAPVRMPPQGELLQIADGSYLLALVSRQTTLGSFVPGDLVQLDPAMVHPAKRQWSYFLRRDPYQALRRMWEAAQAEGVDLLVTSAYRSYETQEELFRYYASRHGEEEANRFSARAGQSEHQLGTAVDFGGTAADFTGAFAETQPGRWLAARAHEFGFALSYPEGTEEITGYIFEPWHFRYIGMEVAQEWKKSGLALSHFLESKPQFWRE